MNEEEKRKYEAFQYWIQTNTEKGVTTIPDTLCLFVVNLINKLQKEFKPIDHECERLEEKEVELIKENEELKEDLKYVLNQTLGAFEKNWCIDWNFTEIREKYNLESE